MLGEDDRRAAALAVALAGITGFTTAVGWITLAGVFVGPQSGNVVVASASVAEGDWPRTVAHGVPVVVFFAALVLGYLGTSLARRRRPVWAVEAMVLAVEAALLAAAGVAAVRFDVDGVGVAPHSHAGLVTAALVITAIGLQSSAVRPVLGERVNTIATTGLLIGTARDLAARLEHGSDATSEVRGGLGARSLMLGSYIVLGVLGGLTERALGFSSLFAAAGVVGALAIVWAVRRPVEHGVAADPVR